MLKHALPMREIYTSALDEGFGLIAADFLGQTLPQKLILIQLKSSFIVSSKSNQCWWQRVSGLLFTEFAGD